MSYYDRLIYVWSTSTTKALIQVERALAQTRHLATDPAVLVTDDPVMVQHLFPGSAFTVVDDPGDQVSRNYHVHRNAPEMLSLPEAAGLARVTSRTIRNWVKHGRLTAHHTKAGALRINRDELASLR